MVSGCGFCLLLLLLVLVVVISGWLLVVDVGCCCLLVGWLLLAGRLLLTNCSCEFLVCGGCWWLVVEAVGWLFTGFGWRYAVG